MLWVTLAPPRGEESFHLDEERDLLPKLRHELGERPGGAGYKVPLEPRLLALFTRLPIPAILGSSDTGSCIHRYSKAYSPRDKFAKSRDG